MIDKILSSRRRDDDDDHWITVSDLMSGLMVIFLFIAITYIRPFIMERATVRVLAATWQENEAQIYRALDAEFSVDLPRWQATLERETLTLKFNAPRVLFQRGSSQLPAEFEAILADFLPRYLRVLSAFRASIEEIRIEGHTSSDWQGRTGYEAYFENMRLSQERTREVLRFGLSLQNATPYRDWAIGLLTANGLSSSRTVQTSGREDPELSRRVEFRVRTKAKEQIVKILETIQ